MMPRIANGQISLHQVVLNFVFHNDREPTDVRQSLIQIEAGKMFFSSLGSEHWWLGQQPNFANPSFSQPEHRLEWCQPRKNKGIPRSAFFVPGFPPFLFVVTVTFLRMHWAQSVVVTDTKRQRSTKQSQRAAAGGSSKSKAKMKKTNMSQIAGSGQNTWANKSWGHSSSNGVDHHWVGSTWRTGISCTYCLLTNYLLSKWLVPRNLT